MEEIDLKTKIKPIKCNSVQIRQKTDKTKGLISNQTVCNTEDSPQHNSLMLAVVPLCEIKATISFNKLNKLKIILNSLILLI